MLIHYWNLLKNVKKNITNLFPKSYNYLCWSTIGIYWKMLKWILQIYFLNPIIIYVDPLLEIIKKCQNEYYKFIYRIIVLFMLILNWKLLKNVKTAAKFINETGFCSLLIASNMPAAQKFIYGYVLNATSL